jgi:hypothetical protein
MTPHAIVISAVMFFPLMAVGSALLAERALYVLRKAKLPRPRAWGWMK